MKPTSRSIFITALLLCSTVAFMGCSSSSDGSPSGGKTLTMVGGNGTTGSAGDGGELYLDGYDDIIIKKTGAADTAFEVPVGPAYKACTDEANIGTDTMAKAIANGDATTAGDYYLVFANTTLYQAAGATANTATDDSFDCLNVASGATFTLGLNYDFVGDGDANESTGSDTVRLQFSNDINIAGTLAVAALDTGDYGESTPDSTYALDMGTLAIRGGSVFVTSTGTVTTAGGDSATDRGGDGGGLRLSADTDSGYFMKVDGLVDASGGMGAAGFDGGDAAVGYYSYVDLWANGMLVVTGDVMANGGSGDNGGDAEELYIESDTHVAITGTVSAVGGTGLAGYGGDGGYMYFYSYAGSIVSSAAIDASGGDGTAGGGSGDEIEFDNDYAAPITITGSLRADGGNSSDLDTDGGDGGYVYIDYYVGPLNMDADISARGGNGTADGGSGGEGGYLEIYVYDDEDYENGEDLAPRDIVVSSNIDFSGGDGTYGGEAGYVDIYQYYTYEVNPPTGLIVLAQYGMIDLDGGDSVGNNGGDGGDVYAYTEEAWSGADYDIWPIGAISNAAPISARGGSSVDDDGGDGGYIDMEAEYYSYEYYDGTTTVTNTAALDVSGGDGTWGGDSGGVYFYAHDGVSNSGMIYAEGGNGDDDGGYGAYDYIEFFSSMDISNTGSIMAAGGNGTDDEGGDGGYYVAMFAGGRVTNSGDIDGSGGDGNADTGYGGDGGEIELFSQATFTSNSGMIDVAGGLGDTAGDTGEILIDWTDFTP